MKSFNFSGKPLFESLILLSSNSHCIALLVHISVQFNWQDALNLDRLLTEEEIMVRDQFKAYCTEKLMPRIVMANRNERKF